MGKTANSTVPLNLGTAMLAAAGRALTGCSFVPAAIGSSPSTYSYLPMCRRFTYAPSSVTDATGPAQSGGWPSCRLARNRPIRSDCGKGKGPFAGSQPVE